MAPKSKKKSNAFEKIKRQVETFAAEPEQFLRLQPEKIEEVHEFLQRVYSCTTSRDVARFQSIEFLPDLVLEDMDEEQVWQQLELRNEFVLPKLVQEASQLLAKGEHTFEVKLDESDAEEEMSEEENEAPTGKNSGTKQKAKKFDYNEDDEEDEEDEEDAAFSPTKNMKPRRKIRPSVVDDKFFKLSEMTEFLEREDAKEMRKQNGKKAPQDDDGINYFADDFDEDDEAENPNYADFFDSDDEDAMPNNKKTSKREPKDHFASDAEEEDEDADEQNATNEEEDDEDVEGEAENGKNAELEEPNETHKTANHLEPASGSDTDSENEGDADKPKSSFEVRQERLKQRINEYEDEVLGEKPWQLKGEVQANSRPQNSLLEEVLEFESTVRPAPVITEETTRCLEDIIRQRIKDKAWDDPVRTVRPIHAPQEFRKKLVLDQEKSKDSLAQIYEKEYLEKTKAATDENNVATEESPEHKKIREMLHDLFIKLDVLTHSRFTPKPVAPEARIITNTSALNMEEAGPNVVSSASLLAPEEVYRGPRHELLGSSERTRTDKNRERRKKKQKQRAVYKAMAAKDEHRQKMGIPLSQKEEKGKLIKQLTKNRNVELLNTTGDKSSLKSSKAFFSKLQDTTSAAGVAAAAAKASKRSANLKTLTAKKVKL